VPTDEPVWTEDEKAEEQGLALLGKSMPRLASAFEQSKMPHGVLAKLPDLLDVHRISLVERRTKYYVENGGSSVEVAPDDYYFFEVPVSLLAPPDRLIRRLGLQLTFYGGETQESKSRAPVVQQMRPDSAYDVHSRDLGSVDVDTSALHSLIPWLPVSFRLSLPVQWATTAAKIEVAGLMRRSCYWRVSDEQIANRFVSGVIVRVPRSCGFRLSARLHLELRWRLFGEIRRSYVWNNADQRQFRLEPSFGGRPILADPNKLTGFGSRDDPALQTPLGGPTPPAVVTDLTTFVSRTPIEGKNWNRLYDLAQVYAASRDLYFDVAVDMYRWEPAKGSRAARDFANEEAGPDGPWGVAPVETTVSIVANHMLEATDGLAALAALHKVGEVLLSPAWLARSVVEHASRAYWIVRAQTVRQRVLRAHLDALVSNHGVQVLLEPLEGRSGKSYIGRQNEVRYLRDSVLPRLFRGSESSTLRTPTLEGESWLKPEACMVWMLEDLSASRPGSSTQHGRRILGQFVNRTHRPPYARDEVTPTLFVTEKELVSKIRPDMSTLNLLAGVVTGSYYNAFSSLLSYMKWTSASVKDWKALAERIMPGLLE
jgi:hypothetical protein